MYGAWLRGRIYLARGYLLSEGTVKHEMLHELLQGDERHAHPLFFEYIAGS